jgi:hypothetical protein
VDRSESWIGIQLVREVIKPELVVRFGDGYAFGFSDWLLGAPLVDPRFGGTYSNIYMAANILHQAKQPRMLLDEQPWELLCDVIRNPSQPYDPRYWIHYVPFCEAILTAQELGSSEPLSALPPDPASPTEAGSQPSSEPTPPQS